MTITIENFELDLTDFGNFDVYECKKQVSKNNKTKVYKSIVAYNVNLQRAMKYIVAKNLTNKKLKVSLDQFLIMYKEEVQKIEKLVDLETLKTKQ